MVETTRLPLLLIGLMLCTAAAADDLVGKMGDVELHSSELKAVLEAQPPEMRRQLATDQSALERLVRSELMRKAVLNEAKQKGWDKRAELQPLIDRARDQIVVSSFVGNVAQPGDGYPSEEEIKQFYEGNKAQLLAPAQYQLAQIFLPAAEGTDKAKAEEAKKKIGELSAKMGKSGADFAKLAKENSAHKESAEKGGELGWVSEEQMVPEIRRAVAGMRRRQPADQIRRRLAPHQAAGQEAGGDAPAGRHPFPACRGDAQSQGAGHGARLSRGLVHQAAAHHQPDRTRQTAKRVTLSA